jgi:hypothetical protein
MTAVRAIVTASLVGLVSAHDTDHDALETLTGLVPEPDSGERGHVPVVLP